MLSSCITLGGNTSSISLEAENEEEANEEEKEVEEEERAEGKRLFPYDEEGEITWS